MYLSHIAEKIKYLSHCFYSLCYSFTKHCWWYFMLIYTNLLKIWVLHLLVSIFANNFVMSISVTFLKFISPAIYLIHLFTWLFVFSKVCYCTQSYSVAFILVIARPSVRWHSRFNVGFITALEVFPTSSIILSIILFLYFSSFFFFPSAAFFCINFMSVIQT